MTNLATTDSFQQLSSDDILTIEQLEDSDAKSIWVLNTSYERNQGAISFQVEGSGGKLTNVEVPFTFVAVNLADSARPRNIIDNEHFRRAVARRLLTIVTPEYARTHNASASAQVELDKIARGISVGVQETSDTLNPSSDIKTTMTNQTQLSMGSTVDVNNPSYGNEQNPELVVDQRIINTMNNDNFSEQERIASLRTNKSYIKLVDAFYISRLAQANDWEEVADTARLILKQLKKRAVNDLGDDKAQRLFAQANVAARAALTS